MFHGLKAYKTAMSDAKPSIHNRPPTPVIVISSLVSGDGVGGGATQSVLFEAGFQPVLVPTVLMGRHPGRGVTSGGPVDPETMESMLRALEASGTAKNAASVFTGYFAMAEHVAVAADFIARVRAQSQTVKIWVDPILGDGQGQARDAGLYVKPDVAHAIRDQLVPLADVITPNLFELAWLTGQNLSDEAHAARAAKALPCDVLVTSAPAREDRVGVLIKTGADLFGLDTPHVRGAPNGTGDVFAATALTEALAGQSLAQSAALSAQRVGQLLTQSQGHDQLVLTPHTLSQPLTLTRPRRIGAKRPAWAMGLDGAPGGWCAVMVDMNGLDDPRHQLFATFQEALEFGAQIMAVDMPMGFADSPGPHGMRTCEHQARQILGPRRSSIFPSPLRPALAAEAYEDALEANRAAGGKGISKQAWHLFPKLREIDALNAPQAEGFLFETHPETSFAVITGAPAVHGKKTAEGREERLALLHRQGLPRDLFDPHTYPRKQVQPDDLVDAGLCALTALRIAAGVERRFPEHPPRDGRGLRMGIFA